MFQVICYAVHEKEIASIDVFSSEEEAYEFIEEDSQNVYNEEVAGGSGKDQMSYVLDYPCAYISSYDGEYEWTWELKEIQEPIQKQLNEYAREACDQFSSRINAWWEEDFESEVQIRSEDDFKNLSEKDLEIAKDDWIDSVQVEIVNEAINIMNQHGFIANVVDAVVKELQERLK